MWKAFFTANINLNKSQMQIKVLIFTYVFKHENRFHVCEKGIIEKNATIK